MRNTIPNEVDWGDYQSDLDSMSAYKRFFGKSNEQARRLFYSSLLEAVDELRFMPEIPFKYYVVAFKDFIKDGDFPKYKASDAVSCFLNIVQEKLEAEKWKIESKMSQLMPVVEYVAMNQSSYKASVSIYGDFNDQLEKIRELNDL